MDYRMYEDGGDDATLPDIHTVGKHKRKHRNEIKEGLVLAGLAVVGLCIGWTAYGLSHRPVGSAETIPADTITVKVPASPSPAAVRTYTRRVPGPTVTRSLKSLVTVRATRTVPGPTVTVTASPTPLGTPDEVSR
jgi:hypothetical protein